MRRLRTLALSFDDALQQCDTAFAPGGADGWTTIAANRRRHRAAIG
ncbi:hypothetical protein [Virgisporangium ochraceum]|nr:hypothetical protein [Virgisporangium ochraceum]